MGESFSKRDKANKKLKARQDKADKKAERKENNSKGKGIEDMMAYIDENGNISATPPDPRKRKEINAEDISLDVSRPQVEEEARNGVVSFFNEDKGYGFITDTKTRENIFVHVNQLLQPIKENDKVEFETEHTPKGLAAIRVKKI